MSIFIAGNKEVSKLLPMKECIEVLEDMFKVLANGEAILPLRQVVPTADKKGVLALMPAYLGSRFRSIGGKFLTAFPGNLSTPYESHQGCVLLFECDNGRLLAVIDASSITAIRTAAASAVATKFLARRDAGDLAILGSGTQAFMHLQAVQEVRDLRRVRLWSRNKQHARNFAARHSDVQIESMDSVAEAVEGADIICTTTASSEPILKGEWISEGCHINAVGASRPLSRELDSQAVSKSRLYTDRAESLFNEADDFRIPRKEGVITDSHLIGEIGELLLGKINGRTDEREITLFKSLGIATEDLASAYHIYDKASRLKTCGAWIEFGGKRTV